MKRLKIFSFIHVYLRIVFSIIRDENFRNRFKIFYSSVYKYFKLLTYFVARTIKKRIEFIDESYK